MVNGWFVFAVVASIVLLSGVVIAVAILRAAWARRERESLTAEDLRAVEESAMILIEQLQSEADRAISEMNNRSEALHALLAEIDWKLEALTEASATVQLLPSSTIEQVACGDTAKEEPAGCLTRQKVLELASGGLGYADIARTVGVDVAEVKLILSLERLAAN
jgi:hypothetical protein